MISDSNPKRSGFGRTLIEQGGPYELGGATSLEFAENGAHATLEFRLHGPIAPAPNMI